MGDNKLENKKIIDTPMNNDLLGVLPKVYKIKGITVNVERELKNNGKNCIDNLIEMIDRKKKEITDLNYKQLTE